MNCGIATALRLPTLKHYVSPRAPTYSVLIVTASMSGPVVANRARVFRNTPPSQKERFARAELHGTTPRKRVVLVALANRPPPLRLQGNAHISGKTIRSVIRRAINWTSPHTLIVIKSVEPTNSSATPATRLPQNGFNSLVVSAAPLSTKVTWAKAQAGASEQNDTSPALARGWCSLLPR